jgi:hypothetical protein
MVQLLATVVSLAATGWTRYPNSPSNSVLATPPLTFHPPKRPYPADRIGYASDAPAGRLDALDVYA